MEAKNCDKIRELILKSTKPFVIKNVLNTWSPLNWSLSKWLDVFTTNSNNGNDNLPFRCNKNTCSKVPQWESTCINKKFTTAEFIVHSLNIESDMWMYFDYKDCATWVKRIPNDMDVPWGLLGFPEQSLMNTTVWIGSKGANTPCHSDTYGCNLVAQVIGRKQWILYPPSDRAIGATQTRVPYEESSIYSRINFQCGKRILDSIDVNSGEPYVVTLEPGDVLFVPHKWWHYVQHLTVGVSVNTWIQLDNMANFHSYVDEFLVQHVFRKFTADENPSIQESYKEMLNPNEWPMLENRDPDESYYDTLKQVFIKNAKYLLPSSQCDSKQNCDSRGDHLEDKSEAENSNENFKVFDDIRGNFEDTNINHTPRSDQFDDTSEDPGNAETSSTSSTPQLLEIVKLSPSTKEEFIEFCRHKCTCFRNSELRLSENTNSNLVPRKKRDNIVKNRNHDSTFFDNLEISLTDQTREIAQRSPSSETSKYPCSERETSSTQCFNLKSSESHETSADTADDTVGSASKQSNKRKLEIPVKCDKSSKRFCDMDEKSREENSPKTEFVGDSSFKNSLFDEWKSESSNESKSEKSNECKSEKSNECKSEKSNECKSEKSNECKSEKSNECKSESSNECKSDKSNHSLSEEEVFAVYPDYLIRAFTHTDVIALVRDKLLEEIRNGQSVYNRHSKRDVD